MVVPKQIQELFQLNVLLICTKDIIPRFKITVFVVHFCRRALCGARELKEHGRVSTHERKSRALCGARELKAKRRADGGRHRAVALCVERVS